MANAHAEISKLPAGVKVQVQT